MDSIYALDCSLAATGFCKVSSGSSFVIEDLTTLKTKHTFQSKGQKVTVPTHDRISHILLTMEELGVFNPENTLVAIEDYAFLCPGRGFTDLVEMQGLIRHALWTKGIPVLLVAPQTIKKWACGKGNAKKPQVIAGAQTRWCGELLAAGFEIQNDNEADALTLAHVAWSFYQSQTIQEFPISKYEKEVYEKLLDRNVDFYSRAVSNRQSIKPL